MRGTDALDRYLAEERQHAFEWGARNRDCMLFLVGWTFIVTQVDHGADWRGFYSDETGARALICERGGLVAVMDGACGPRASLPARRGDIGLFQTPEGEMGMICTGKLWAAKPKRGGVALARFQPFAHWALGFA
ncbi:DUF6950 family protein [Allomesorhizobium camelthorni]|uniref:DUF6950 domain-containing protein n=1 Tax=Allomesorhizobium camelthorni TaxID=475069 RepID=A0A6G4W8D6_9HYPH|nr:hypothetical protein [Mesorhizobium camelthorni]NGO50420.1 hypothetical protein [Mesorhizobium camelthorni]